MLCERLVTGTSPCDIVVASARSPLVRADVKGPYRPAGIGLLLRLSQLGRLGWRGMRQNFIADFILFSADDRC